MAAHNSGPTSTARLHDGRVELIDDTGETFASYDLDDTHVTAVAHDGYWVLASKTAFGVDGAPDNTLHDDVQSGRRVVRFGEAELLLDLQDVEGSTWARVGAENAGGWRSVASLELRREVEDSLSRPDGE